MLSLWYSQILPRAETALSVAMILSAVRELGSLIVALSLCKAAARKPKKKPQFQMAFLTFLSKSESSIVKSKILEIQIQVLP